MEETDRKDRRGERRVLQEKEVSITTRELMNRVPDEPSLGMTFGNGDFSEGTVVVTNLPPRSTGEDRDGVGKG